MDTVSTAAPDEPVLFLDLLGFAALTEQHPQQHHSYILEGGFSVDRFSDAATQFSRFHLVIDHELQEGRLRGGVKAMIFSDCAFLILGHSITVARVAAELMRRFIQARLPVRMGIGHGTFHPIRFSSDTSGSSTVNRAMFTGTGVVRANRAEGCGAKGMRVFLHPSMKDELSSIAMSTPVMPLAQPLKDAAWELNYLPRIEAGDTEKMVERRNKALFDSVAAMMPSEADHPAAIQYSETLAAINRMKGGKPFSLKRAF